MLHNIKYPSCSDAELLSKTSVILITIFSCGSKVMPFFLMLLTPELDDHLHFPDKFNVLHSLVRGQTSREREGGKGGGGSSRHVKDFT